MDIHEDMLKPSGYNYCKFFDPISNTNTAKKYINKIQKKCHFLKFYIALGGTSQKYVAKLSENEF